jgi:predicted DNA-binding protein
MVARPKSENPKHNQYRLRMTDEELEMLEQCCERTGMTKAEVIRRGIELVYKENNIQEVKQ